MMPMLRIWNNLFARRPDTGRWNRFLHSRQWLGLPAAAVTAFVVLFPLCRFAEGIPTPGALRRGAVYALLVAFSWALGVWASTGDDPEEEPETQGREAPDTGKSRPAWLGWALLLALFALICESQIADMVRGESSLAHGFGGILLKAMAVVAVFIPVWSEQKRK